MLVIAVVDLQFRIVEIDVGENFVFLKDVIGHHRLLRFTADIQMLELLKTAHHEGELGLKSGAPLTFVKSPQERIVFRLNHALRVELVSNTISTSALADADRTFDCYVSGWFEKLGHLVAAYRANRKMAIEE